MEENTSLRDFLNAEPESAGDTGEPTPEVAPAPPATETTEAAPPADTAPDATGDDEDAELRTLIEQAKSTDPRFAELLDRSHKAWQRGVTPKLQERSDLQRQIEGLDPADLQWLKQFNEARVLNPDLARQMWEQATQQVLGQSAPPVTDEDEYVTDKERQLDQRLSQAEKFLEEQRLANIRSEVDRQFSTLEAELKTQIPHEQRLATLQAMAQANAPYTQAHLYWKGMYGFEHARRTARVEGERLGAQKATLGAPPSAQVNAEPAELPPAASLREHLVREVGNV